MGHVLITPVTNRVYRIRLPHKRKFEPAKYTAFLEKLMLLEIELLLRNNGFVEVYEISWSDTETGKYYEPNQRLKAKFWKYSG